MPARRGPKLGYRWKLRTLMAEQGMFCTTDIAPLLAERGVALSAAQVYRLVAQTPERLNLSTLVALCDILDCGPGDLIEPVAAADPQKKKAAGGGTASSAGPEASRRTPRRARIDLRR